MYVAGKVRRDQEELSAQDLERPIRISTREPHKETSKLGNQALSTTIALKLKKDDRTAWHIQAKNPGITRVEDSLKRYRF